MKAMHWQAAIVLTIIGGFVVAYLVFSFKRALQIGLGVTLFWLTWTLGLSALFVGYSVSGPLGQFQLYLIVLVGLAGVALVYSFRKWQHRNECLLIENQSLRNEAKELQNSFQTPDFNKSLSPSKIIRGTKQHRKELLQHVNTAKDRILILSGWVTYYGFDQKLKKALEKAVKRKVEIHIGWGYKSKQDLKNQNIEKMTESERDLLDFHAGTAPAEG